MKQCKKCKETRPFDEFYKQDSVTHPYAPNCKQCKYAYNQQYKRKNWNRIHDKRKGLEREYQLKTKYGITLQAYDEMLKAQGGCCGICGLPEEYKDRSGNIAQLCVDHCHTTNKVRKLLCKRCNMALGLMRDNPELLDVAANYIRYYR